MATLLLHAFHSARGGAFGAVNGVEAVSHYGDSAGEHAAVRGSAALLDLSFRSRLCLLGGDRERFLNGQVTNNVKALQPGEGCYAALVNAKARLESDLNIHRLPDEFLLDFEPGLTATVTQRFERFIIADDVRIVDVAPHYGLLSVQGPRSADAVRALELRVGLPAREFASVLTRHPVFGDVYVMNQPRVGGQGFDVFTPVAALDRLATVLAGAVSAVGGRLAGWDALELARIEAGIPRFGQDMDATNLAPEAGLESCAISYSKGCYIGQEVIARIRTYGQVARALRGLRLADSLPALPARGDKLFKDGKEVGYLTSAAYSPLAQANLGLGYVRRECNAIGTQLALQTGAAETPAIIVPLPFIPATNG